MKKTYAYLLLFLFVPFLLNGQNIQVRIVNGTVTNKATGESIAGVNVFVPGSTRGVTTDIDGHYKFDAYPNDSLLSFSFIGYVSQIVNIKNQTQVNVSLEEDIQNLEEVVVVGYGTQRKSDLTGAVSVVNVKELNKRSVASIDQALQGQVAGVSVTSNTGTPGGSVMVRIRGIGTLNNSDPLFVVDGMMVNDINFLNSNDIENMQVLKDASATAIYGSRGSNGVVIITTKKGQKGLSRVTVNSYYGVQNFWRSSNVLDGPTWGYLKNEALVAAGSSPAIADPSVLPTTNWLKEVSNINAPISNVDLSISGGGDKGAYFLSLNSFGQEGIVKKTNYDRLSLRVNSNYEVNGWLKIGENITLAKTADKTGTSYEEWSYPIIASLTRDPVTPVRNPDGSFTKGIYNGIRNPLATIEYTNNKDVVYRTLGNLFADIKIFNGLILRTNYSLEYSFGETSSYTPVYFVSANQLNSISTMSKTDSNALTGQWSNTLNYENAIGYHSLSALIGVETYSYDYKYNGFSVNNFPSDNPDVRYPDNALGKNVASVIGSISQERQFSGLARVNYAYMDKYLFTVNFRADASSKFTKKNRWGYFPSFSVGWKISEESFIKSIEFISSMKIRVGWGQIGNQGSVAPYQYVTSAYSGSNYLWGGKLASGFCFPGTGNEEIKWETSSTTNVGLDFGIFSGKFSGSVEYFIKKTTDMLLHVPVPGQTGIQNAPAQNAGEMKNSGFELTLEYKNGGHDFSYSVGTNFSIIRNEVISLGKNNPYIDGAFFMNQAYLTRTIVGQSMAQFYGLKTDGLFQNWDEVHAQTAQENVAPGDVRYVDANKDGELDFYFLGSPLPDLTYAFNASCMYQGFDLSFSIQGVHGNKIFNGPSYYTRSSTAAYNLSRDMVNRWSGEGTQTDARYPRMNANDVNNSQMSDRMIEDGSYLRIKNLQIGYNLPESIAKRIMVQNLRIYINMQNLLTITKYSGLDPEIGLRDAYDPLDLGVDRGLYPQARVYSIGLNFSF